MLTKALLLLVGKEVAEFLVIDSTLKLIGQGAKRRKHPMKNNVSFDAVRNMVAKNVMKDITVQATQAATTKVVDAAKSVGGYLKGVAPVTQNGLDERTLELLKVAVINAMQLESLKDQLRAQGFEIVDDMVDPEDVDSTAEAYLHVMKGVKKLKKAQKKEAVKEEAPQVALELNMEAIKEMVEAQSTKVDEGLKTAPASSGSGIQLSTPTNWHLGTQG